MKCPSCGTENIAGNVFCTGCGRALSRDGTPVGPHLIWRTDDGSPQAVALSRTLTIGRVAGNDIVVPDSAVSRQHARVQVEGGLVLVVDLGSLNGVFVNGERVSEEIAVQDGDVVRVGRTLFTVSIPQEADSPERPAQAVEPSEGTVFLADASASGEMALAADGPSSAETIVAPASPFAPVDAEPTVLVGAADADRTIAAPLADDDVMDSRTIAAGSEGEESGEHTILAAELDAPLPAPSPAGFLVHNDERTPIDAEVSVGRADGNTIRLANDRAISRQHARFVVKSDGVWLEDLGSANGSYVNDNRVIQPVLLKDGDAVLLGNTAFAFEAPVAPAPAAEEEPALWPGATDRIRAAVPDEVEDIQEQTLQGDEAELYMREAELAQFQALRAGDTEPQAGLGRSAVDQYRLVINFGPETGREFPLYKDVTFIGRAAPEVDYEIQLNDRAVSRPHARIVKSAGGFVIEDVASANGTWLNYTEEIKVPRALADGDVLKLGKTTLVYRVPAAVRPPEPEIVLDPSQGQIISVFTLKGGVGTSTLAVNLAIVLHRITQQRVLLIDLATERGADTVHLNVTPKLTLADLPTDPSMIDEDVIHSLILSHSSGVDFLAAPPSPQTAELVTAAGITTLMPLARGKYKWVIIDTNPSFSELNLGVFDQSDLVLLLQSPDVSSLKVMQSSLDVFAALQTPPEKRVLVLNQTHPHPHITREDLEQSLGERIGVELPYAGDDVLDSIDRGVPLAVGRPEHPFVLAVESFASQLAEVKVAAVERPRKGGFGSWMQGLLGGLKR